MCRREQLLSELDDLELVFRYLHKSKAKRICLQDMYFDEGVMGLKKSLSLDERS